MMVSRRCSYSTNRGLAAVGLAILILLATSSSAWASVTKLTEGTGISLSPHPITSSGTISLALPLAIKDPLSSSLFSITNTGSGHAINATGSVGVRAAVNGTGKYAVIATGGDGGAGLKARGGPLSGYGVYALGSGLSQGVLAYGGTSGGSGVEGVGGGTNAYGVYGLGTGANAGVLGMGGANGAGVQATGQGAGAGVTAVGGSSADGLDATAAAPGKYGVSGVSTCADAAACATGAGASEAAGGAFTGNEAYGVFGYSSNRNAAYFENNTDNWYALYVTADSAAGYPLSVVNSATGGYLTVDPHGNVSISGSLTQNAIAPPPPVAQTIPGRIAPPAPSASSARATVGASSGESEFDGNVTTDARGYATVHLPASFDAQNSDPRYQLTAVGRHGWNARIGVWSDERDNRFVIRSDQPRVRVSWRLTATPRPVVPRSG